MKTLQNLKKLTNSQMGKITGGDDVSMPFRNRINILPPPPPPPHWPERDKSLKVNNSLLDL